jgi:hypothetical protein
LLADPFTADPFTAPSAATPLTIPYTDDQHARLAALAAEARAITASGKSPNFNALWQKHLPDVPRARPSTPSASAQLPRNSAHPNAQSPADRPSPSAVQNETTQQVATTTRVAAEPPIARNP